MKILLNARCIFLLQFLFLTLCAIPCKAQNKKNSSFKNVSYGTPASVTRSVSPAGINSSGNHYVIVTLTINKNSIKGKAILEEDMTSVLGATEIVSSGAKFAVKNGAVTFTWKKLPEADGPITIKYQLQAFSSIPDKITLTGKFECGDNSVMIPATDFTMKIALVADSSKKGVLQPPNASNEMKTDTVKKTPLVLQPHHHDTTTETVYAAPLETNTTLKKEKQHKAKPSASGNQPPKAKEEDTTSSVPGVYPVCTVPPPVLDESKHESIKTNEPATMPTETAASNTGIYYRIQIGAFSDEAKVQKLLTRCKITEKPYTEATDKSGTRYLIGKYTDINIARSRMEELKESGLDGAYLVPYYQERRITFKEAGQIQSNSNIGNTKQQ